MAEKLYIGGLLEGKTLDKFAVEAKRVKYGAVSVETALNQLGLSAQPFSFDVTGGCLKEIGSTYAPTGNCKAYIEEWNITKKTSFSCGSVTFDEDDPTLWSAGSCETDTDWEFTAIYSGNVMKKTVEARFLPYLYKGECTEAPEEINEELIKKLNASLSNDTTLNTTELAAGRYYIFACKGEITLVCRENGTNGIVSATTGTVDVTRHNETAIDKYSYIIIGPSTMPWAFKITNN